MKNDVISRQAAINEINALPKWPDAVSSVCLDYADVMSVLQDNEKLPSAQPEIIRCKDCKWLCGLSGQYCDIHERMASNDSYCSWAERREDE